MNQSQHEKVTARHLRRNAYLDIRQSTLRQVFENTESTRRQYALSQRALALGWSEEQLHNPRYAGAFVFGRTRMRKKADGGVFYERLPKEEWQVILRDAHVGYLTWEQYQENERRLREGAQSYGHERRQSPAREGAALLQGIVVCGLCGRRMTVRYRTRSGRSFPDYRCQRESIDACAPECQSIPGALSLRHSSYLAIRSALF